jgi:hypothetical protein
MASRQDFDVDDGEGAVRDVLMVDLARDGLLDDFDGQDGSHRVGDGGQPCHILVCLCGVGEADLVMALERFDGVGVKLHVVGSCTLGSVLFALFEICEDFWYVFVVLC